MDKEFELRDRFVKWLPRPLSIFVTALVLAVFGVGLRVGLPIHHRHSAIQEVERLGGRMTTARGGPDWLRDRIPSEWQKYVCDPVRVAQMSDSQLTDDGCRYVGSLKDLTFLNLSARPVTDNGLMHLKGLSEMEWLILGETQVTNAGVEYIAGFNKLERLDLHGTNITDDALHHLKGLRALIFLDLSGTAVTDAGIKSLKQLSDLLTLCISGTKITDVGIAELKEALPDLEVQQ